MKGKPAKTARSESRASTATSSDSLARPHAAARPRETDIDLTGRDAREALDWPHAVRGRFYRPTKQRLTPRVDADVVD